MRLHELKVENFGPYFGAQSLTFSANHPVTIVHGDNMRGKSSLLNALRWVLYDQADDRFGRPIPRIRLLNSESASRGNFTMAVNLTLDVDGTTYELVRAIQPKVPGSSPRSDADFAERLMVRRAGAFLPASQSQTEINRILPRDVSRFFLFDGEMLNRFERLLGDTDRDAQAIKESIEEILGVPSVMNAIADLRGNLREAARRQQSAATADRQANVYAAQAVRYEGEIEALEIDLARLRERHGEWRHEQDELAETLESMARTEAEIQRLKDLDEQVKSRNTEATTLAQQKRDALGLAWRDLMQPRLAARLSSLEREQATMLHSIADAATLTAETFLLEQARSTGHCSICAQSVSDMTSIDARLRDIESHEKPGFDHERFSQIAESIRKLRLLAPPHALASIVETEQRAQRNLVELTHLELRQEEIRRRLGPVDQSSVARTRWDYEQHVKLLGALEADIETSAKDIAEKQRLAAENRAQIKRHSGPGMAKLNREVELYEQLIDLFQCTLAALRDELKVSVERDASDIFRRLTTDKSYTGLSINDRYGLAIIDDGGREVSVRSAGAEQIVALALIGALNRNAVRQGPIVMDTPFGRLDPKHRRNVLEFVPTMAEQVTLLVHAGEFDRGRDLAFLSTAVEAEYELQYVSSRETLIVLMKESGDGA